MSGNQSQSSTFQFFDSIPPPQHIVGRPPLRVNDALRRNEEIEGEKVWVLETWKTGDLATLETPSALRGLGLPSGELWTEGDVPVLDEYHSSRLSSRPSSIEGENRSRQIEDWWRDASLKTMKTSSDSTDLAHRSGESRTGSKYLRELRELLLPYSSSRRRRPSVLPVYRAPHLPQEIICLILLYLHPQETTWSRQKDWVKWVLSARLINAEWYKSVSGLFVHPYLIVEKENALASLPPRYPFRIHKLYLAADLRTSDDVGMRRFETCKIRSLYVTRLAVDPWLAVEHLREVEELVLEVTPETRCSQDTITALQPLPMLSSLGVKCLERFKVDLHKRYEYDSPLLFPSRRQLPNLRYLDLEGIQPPFSPWLPYYLTEQSRLLASVDHFAPQLQHLSVLELICPPDDTTFFSQLHMLESLRFRWRTKGKGGWATRGWAKPNQPAATTRILPFAVVLQDLPVGVFLSRLVLEDFIEDWNGDDRDASPMWLPFLIGALDDANFPAASAIKVLQLLHCSRSSAGEFRTIRESHPVWGPQLLSLCARKNIQVWEKWGYAESAEWAECT